MTVSTFYGNDSDGRVNGMSNTYLTARSTAYNTDGYVYVGQNLVVAQYRCYEAFVSFLTSDIPDGDTITAVVLSLYLVDNATTTDFTIEARWSDFGAALATADWVAGASLSALTKLATFATSGLAGGYNTFTSAAAFLANVSKTGTTYILLDSDRMVAATVPTNSENVGFCDSESSGTTNDPKLVVTHVWFSPHSVGSGIGSGISTAIA